MSNSNSKVTLKLSPQHENARVNETLDVGSPTPTGFNGVFENKNYQSFDKQLIEKNVIGGHIEQNSIGGLNELA